jgi:DNA-binding HxlR family transcriptional regulator
LYNSKLHMYIEILCALVSHGPLKLAQLKGKVELDKHALIEVLNFLYEHCLVGEQNLDETQKAYFVTERGMSVLKVVAPLIREAQKVQMQNFEVTSNALSKINSGTKKQKRIAFYSKKRIFPQRTQKM